MLTSELTELDTFTFTAPELAPDPATRQKLYENLSGDIGDTPLYIVEELNANKAMPILQKNEFYNPSGSHYDRVYLPTIKYLEDQGLVRPDDELRDITSGSAGISLSLIGNYLGYRVRVTVPDELPEARIQPMKVRGATVLRCGPGYIQAASKFQRDEIHQLVKSGWQRIRSDDPDMRAIVLQKKDQRICYINHSENALSPQSFAAIGVELDRDWQGLQPYAVVLAMGNWTSIAGISAVVREHWPETRIIGYEGDNRTIHDNYGTTVEGIPFRFKDESLVDEQRVVTNIERNLMDERINHDPASRFHPTQYQLGHSSLMGMVVAEQLAHEKNTQDPTCESPVICLAYDQKMRY